MNRNSQASQAWAKVARRVRVPLGFVFAGIYLWLARPTLPGIALGAPIALLGLCLRALASGHVRKNEELTTSGPYRYTRNPLYLGSVIIAAGFAVCAARWSIAAILVLLFVAIYLPVIRSEEEFLRSRFSNFDEYAAHVPRLLPRRTGKSLWAGFSFELYRKHREYNAAIGAFAILIALLLKWFRTA